MGDSFGMAVVQGPKVDLDAVRRALWLPRKPDARHSIRAMTTSPVGDEWLGIRAREDWVEVFGTAVAGVQVPWEELSRGGARVFVFLLAEGSGGSAFSIYEDGRRVRRRSEIDGTEEGETHDLELPADADESAADRIGAIHQAMTGEDPTQDLEPGAAVDAWRVH